jgi:hypothetical protein
MDDFFLDNDIEDAEINYVIDEHKNQPIYFGRAPKKNKTKVIYPEQKPME